MGRWDPFNVTEDADLGMRLWRGGYRTAMISRPTLEDAPHTLGAWLPQRTRWFKGWMQTWIVHTREPARLYRNMHLRAFVITQLLLTGTFVSALLHPLVLVNAVGLSIWLTVQSPDPAYMSLIAWIDWLMIAASYLAFGALFASGTKPLARRASLDLFGQVRALQLGLPLVGIGGIDAGNIGTVLAAGADAAAVIGSLFGQGDVGAAARALVAAAGRG